MYERGAVPPDAVIVTVPVPELQRIGEVTAALAVIAVGSLTLIVPETGPQELASVTLHATLLPAVIPENMPVAFVTPL